MHSLILKTVQLHKIQTYHALAFHFNHCTAHLVVNPATPSTNSNVLLQLGSQSYGTCMCRQLVYSMQHKRSEGQSVGD